MKKNKRKRKSLIERRTRTEERNYTAKNLEAETQYSFSIRAVDARDVPGAFLYINQSTLHKGILFSFPLNISCVSYLFSFHAVAPGKPSAPTRTRYSRDYITVSWLPHEDDGGVAVDLFTLSYSIANSSWVSVNITYPSNSYLLSVFFYYFFLVFIILYFYKQKFFYSM